jgi:hypothetical protein
MKRCLIALVVAGVCISSACTSVGGGAAREPAVRVGINVSTYPRLSRIPGYPVYYAPGVGWNYFFYEDRYWVFENDLWYASRGYNGPWDVIDPFFVPSYVLRVPVRYYTRPPSYFRGWRADAPPRWDEHWGRDWSARRSDWNRWDPRSAPPAVPPRDYPRATIDDRDSGAPGLQRYNPPGNTREQRREPPGLQRGNTPLPRSEAQQGQPSRMERAPASAQPQEQRQERGQQQNDAPADRGRDRKGGLDRENNPRGR